MVMTRAIPLRISRLPTGLESLPGLLFERENTRSDRLIVRPARSMATSRSSPMATQVSPP